jgi:hypothetical protein
MSASHDVPPTLSGRETAKWVALGVAAFFGVPLLGFSSGPGVFLVVVGGLAYAGVQAWKRGERSRARVRRFLVGLGLGLVIFGGCFVLVLAGMDGKSFH